jgi:hypothetical protein
MSSIGGLGRIFETARTEKKFRESFSLKSHLAYLSTENFQNYSNVRGGGNCEAISDGAGVSL